MLTSSHAYVPLSKEAQNASGLPWSVAVDLLVQPPAPALRPASSIERCQHCFAYINKFCTFERKQWRCSLCGDFNSLSEQYEDPAARLQQAELNADFLDFELTQDQPVLPALLILVDVTGDKAYLDAVKSGVQAAFEALSESFLVGLMTVGAKVGVFHLSSSVPVVRNIPLTHAGDLSLGLDEAFEFSQIFVPKAEAQKHFAIAVESLSEVADANPAHCFGTAIAAVAEYLTLRSTVSPVTFARTLCFLSSAPSYGLGALSAASLSDPRATSEFYTDVATKAAKVGARIDLIALGRANFGLAPMRVLSQYTNGAIMLYADPQAATLPQDLYRQLSGHQGMGGILRLRTTTEIDQDGHLGNVYASPSATHLYHVGGCDQFSSLLFALRVRQQLEEGHAHTLQLAFAFFHVPPSGPARRVLRVHTVQLPAMKDWHGLYGGIDPEVVCSTVVQKSFKNVAAGGFRAAEQHFLEWVQSLTSCARRHASWQPDAIDPVTGAYVLPSLEQILRFCFAFKRSGLLSAPQSNDQWAHTMHQLNGLSRRLTRRLVCPVITPFSASLEAAGSCLPLNRLSLQVSPVVLLDALSTIIVLYTDSAGDTPYPPPKDSPLREALAALSSDRPSAPSVAIGRMGSAEHAALEAHLVEDAPDNPYRTWLAALQSGALIAP